MALLVELVLDDLVLLLRGVDVALDHGAQLAHRAMTYIGLVGLLDGQGHVQLMRGQALSILPRVQRRHVIVGVRQLRTAIHARFHFG